MAADDSAALSDRFDTKLEFGTAGLRGLLGAGPYRMNRATVRRTTAGLCSYLLRNVPHAHARGIVIARDGRRGSETFARDAARVAMGMGFVVHYFSDLAPTPLASFATRDLGAAAGIMITASHNPGEYNGYKVYWHNAAQIIPPHDAGIAGAIAAIQSVKGLTLLDQEAGKTLGLFRTVSSDVLKHYFESVAALRFDLPEDRDLSIAYTPMHGVGWPYAKRAFQEGGFTRVAVVALQEKPDGAFPTVRFPNPEEPGAMDLVLKLAAEEKSDLILANDPDADRLAVAYRERDGQYVTLTGNQIGVLLGHHRLVDDPKPAADRLVISTIVSSPQLGLIAKAARRPLHGNPHRLQVDRQRRDVDGGVHRHPLRLRLRGGARIIHGHGRSRQGWRQRRGRRGAPGRAPEVAGEDASAIDWTTSRANSASIRPRSTARPTPARPDRSVFATS